MFDRLEHNHWVDGLCDTCAQLKLHDVALTHVEPGVMDEKGCWTDMQFTKEKSAKWGEALRKASIQLTTRCLKIWTVDADWGIVCKNCLQAMMDTPDDNKERTA